MTRPPPLEYEGAPIIDDRPTPEEERIEVWEYWHQRSRKLEELLVKVIKIAPRPWMCENGVSWLEWNEVMSEAERILKEQT